MHEVFPASSAGSSTISNGYETGNAELVYEGKKGDDVKEKAGDKEAVAGIAQPPPKKLKLVTGNPEAADISGGLIVGPSAQSASATRWHQSHCIWGPIGHGCFQPPRYDGG